MAERLPEIPQRPAQSHPDVTAVTDYWAPPDHAVAPPRWFMSFHPVGLVVFVFLTVLLVVLFAAGLCQRDPGREESELERKSLWN